jgi:hypothetical protein
LSCARHGGRPEEHPAGAARSRQPITCTRHNESGQTWHRSDEVLPRKEHQQRNDVVQKDSQMTKPMHGGSIVCLY